MSYCGGWVGCFDFGSEWAQCCSLSVISLAVINIFGVCECLQGLDCVCGDSDLALWMAWVPGRTVLGHCWVFILGDQLL